MAVFKEKVYVLNAGADRVEVFSTNGAYLYGFGGEGILEGQFFTPAGIAVTSTGNVWVTDWGNNRVQEFSATDGKLIAHFGSSGTGNGLFKGPRGVTIDAKGNIWVVDAGNNRVQEFSSTGTYIKQFGSAGTGNGQFKEARGIVADSKENLWVADSGNSRIQEFSNAGAYLFQFGSFGFEHGQFISPSSVAFDPTGHLWVMGQEFTTTGEYIQEIKSGAQGLGFDSSGNAWASESGGNLLHEFALISPSYHAAQTTYYTAGNNPLLATCGKHPEWAGLPCRSQPAQQPATGNPLPVVTDTYNIWDEVENVTEEFGATTRTKKSIYDGAGRLKESEVTSSIDTALPKVTNEYSSETGAMIKQSTTVAEKTQSIASVYNKLGQLTEYTDADGNKATYSYEIDGQVEEMHDGKGSQVYAYDPITKTLTKLLDISAGTFTATYTTEGKIASETYPNGMTAKYVYNELGQTTHVEYVKETHCTENCTWFSEGETYSLYGNVVARSSTLANETYTYDNADRLTQTQETPAGLGCKTRVYAYDKDSNRLSLTTREPAAEGKCATSGGTVESHTYNEADRLSDTGTTYEAFGNKTAVPAADAGGHEITSTFYVSNQTRSSTQNGETITYNLDPEGRSREVVSTGTTNSTVINHYVVAGDAVAWSNEGGEKYTRNIPGIDGALSATEKNGETPVLQLHDLAGNVVAQAALSETETKLLASYNSTEFGVPSNGTPPQYSWLGASGYSADFASGASGSRGAGYVPQLGGVLQTQPITPPGVVPPGTWASGPYQSTMEAWVGKSDAAWGAESSQREAARLQKAAEAALAEALRAAGEGEDPTYYYTQRQAEKVGSALEQVYTIAEYLNFIVALPEGAIKYAEGVIRDHWDGVEKALEWFQDAGKELLKCAKESFVCQFTFWEIKIDLKIKLLNIFTFKVEDIGVDFGLINLLKPAVVNQCLGFSVVKPKKCFHV